MKLVIDRRELAHSLYQSGTCDHGSSDQQHPSSGPTFLSQLQCLEGSSCFLRPKEFHTRFSLAQAGPDQYALIYELEVAA